MTVYKILIIEDEALVARELKSRLTNMGYEVVGIAHGFDGIELARKTKPDLLLTDIHLKHGEDGIQLAQQVQAESNLPVVFLTAYSDDDTVARAKAVTPYGYIIKPVENRELQIVIEMAIYKFNIENELRETQQLLQTALTCIGSALVFVGNDGRVTDINPEAEALLNLGRNEAIGQSWSMLFALDPESSVGTRIARAVAAKEVTQLSPFVISPDQQTRLVDGIVGPMEGGAVLIVRALSEIHDPIESLAGETLAGTEGASMCQLMIAVDVDEGDSLDAVEQASALVNQSLRSTDLVSSFGSNQLSVSMPYTSLEEGRQIAGSLLKSLRDALSSQTRFSLGLASASPNDQQPFEIFRRANWALNVSRESGGNRVILWRDEAEHAPAEARPGSGERDYLNVVLLWNVMNVVAKASDIEELAMRLCHHLQASFEFAKVAVIERQDDSIVSLAGHLMDSRAFGGVGDLGLTQADFDEIQRMVTQGAELSVTDRRLMFRINQGIILYIEALQPVPPADLEFLQTLVHYASTGFVRETEALAVPEGQNNELLFQSPRMQSIMESVKLVGPTDATVLIIGESGTGKERLARAIHNASPRAGRPFTIVDCGAVVGSLIESELFGHVKGAFTGADRHTSGRLKESDGGTVLLDEVGELPLDVQVKLLRFVQEHQIAAVGSNRYETVDTRVIAATNRDLQTLVKQGRFREDLFYRLNVFTIETPPLREREGDVLLLARHYLDHYAHQYGKRILGFTADAEQALMEQAWPGNIRELMNIINRAVILCKDSTVSNIHLGLFTDSRPVDTGRLRGPRASLQEWLAGLVDASLATGELPPLAQWLEEDLILATLAINADVLNRAAQALGIPESTLRRKVSRIRDDLALVDRPRHSDSIEPLMAELVAQADANRQTLLEAISTTLLRELESRRLNRQDAAALMGVSLPTYRKMINDSQ